MIKMMMHGRAAKKCDVIFEGVTDVCDEM